MFEKGEELRCPYCGQPYAQEKVVGKTQSVHRGVRATYEVVTCTCGKNFRGRLVSEKRLPPRR